MNLHVQMNNEVALRPAKVVIAVLRSKGCVALGLRHDGTWALPRGVIKPSETPRTASVRALAEEVGIMAWAFKDLGSRFYEGERRAYIECQHVAGKLENLQPAKFKEVAWKSEDEVLQLIGDRLFENVAGILKMPQPMRARAIPSWMKAKVDAV